MSLLHAEQEALGLDVLVHGEAERTDMVEFFGQELEVRPARMRRVVGGVQALLLLSSAECSLGSAAPAPHLHSLLAPILSHPLQGFHFTTNGWVQSYGSRYVRPPIIVSDVKFLHPMTVDEFKVSAGHQKGLKFKLCVR